jgi:hypothetical protein
VYNQFEGGVVKSPPIGVGGTSLEDIYAVWNYIVGSVISGCGISLIACCNSSEVTPFTFNTKAVPSHQYSTGLLSSLTQIVNPVGILLKCEIRYCEAPYTDI